MQFDQEGRSNLVLVQHAYVAGPPWLAFFLAFVPVKAAQGAYTCSSAGSEGHRL